MQAHRPVFGNLHGEDRRQVMDEDTATCDADEEKETFLVQSKLSHTQQDVVKLHLL